MDGERERWEQGLLASGMSGDKRNVLQHLVESFHQSVGLRVAYQCFK